MYYVLCVIKNALQCLANRIQFIRGSYNFAFSFFKCIFFPPHPFTFFFENYDTYPSTILKFPTSVI